MVEGEDARRHGPPCFDACFRSDNACVSGHAKTSDEAFHSVDTGYNGTFIIVLQAEEREGNNSCSRHLQKDWRDTERISSQLCRNYFHQM